MHPSAAVRVSQNEVSRSLLYHVSEVRVVLLLLTRTLRLLLSSSLLLVDAPIWTGCKDWTCAEWCTKYDSKFDAQYTKEGCADDSEPQVRVMWRSFLDSVREVLLLDVKREKRVYCVCPTGAC